MKQKIMILFLSTLLLSACGNTEASKKANADSTSAKVESETVTNDLSELEAMGDVKVDEKIFDVEITLPKEYVDNTQEELDETCKEKGYKSITINEDGSATYIMTKNQHKELMDEMKNNIDTSLSDLICSEEYPSFTRIDTNDNFTEFTITTTSSELNLNESFSVMMFYMYGGVYNIFNGTPVDNIHIDFINEDSGDIISSANSNDMKN